MKKLQKGFVVPLLIAIIAVLVVGGGIYISKIKKVETPAVVDNGIQPANNQTINTQASISNWKIYTSTKYGFEIKYPPTWFQSVHDTAFVLKESNCTECDPPTINISSLEKYNKSRLEDIYNGVIQQKIDFKKDCTAINFVGVSAYKCLIDDALYGGTLGIYFYNNGVPFVIYDSMNSETSSQILSTFKFISLSASTNNQSPIITKVEGPQSLNLNQQGTWTITASNAVLYYVVWGDEAQNTKNHNLGQQKSATFTHSYSDFGKYMPKFYAQNSNGDVQKSVSVDVINSTSTGLNTAMNGTYTYSKHGFTIELRNGFIPKEEQSEGGPAIMISLPTGGLAYVTDASFWEKYNIPNYTYIKDQKIGETIFKIYSTQEGKIYWFKQGNVGYEFSLFKFGESPDTFQLEALIKTFKFVGWQ